MAHVNTLLGTIHPEEIGTTAIHEHIMWGLPGWEFDPSAWPDIGKAFEKSYHELIDFRLLGGRTYVDCSGIGQGRDLDIYIKLAQSTGINIIASTGFCTDEGTAPYFRAKDIDYLEELYVHELIEGMGHTKVKAGVIRVGNSEGQPTKLEEAQHRAAARAAKRTGAIVITNGVSSALWQLETLMSEGLDASRIVISHLDSKDNLDLERDKKIARAGAYVAYDQIGIEEWSHASCAMSDARRVELVQEMLKLGFQDRMLLSANSMGWRLEKDGLLLHSAAHVLRSFVPALRRAGVTEEALNDMLIENPKRVLPIQ